MSELKKAKYLGGIEASLMPLGLIIIFFGTVQSQVRHFPQVGELLIGLFFFIFGIISALLAVKKVATVTGQREIFQNSVLALGIALLSLPASFAGPILILVAMIFLSRALKVIGKIIGKKLFFWSANTFLFIGILSILLVLPEVAFLRGFLLGQKFLFTLFFHFGTLWMLGLLIPLLLAFLLLAIAFFTLPENLPQKSLTEKKEM